MTHPTKAIYHTLLSDFVRLSKGGRDEALYGEAELDASMRRIEVIDFHQTVEINGIKVRPAKGGGRQGWCGHAHALRLCGCPTTHTLALAILAPPLLNPFPPTSLSPKTLTLNSPSQPINKTTRAAGQITPYRAGHVLGAAMFMVEIAGMRCLYTGDYSRVADRHLSAADLPESRPHVVIVESTYGTSRHEPRAAREERFLRLVHDTVRRGGRVLLPIVALGRAQARFLFLGAAFCASFWPSRPRLPAPSLLPSSQSISL